MPDRFATPLGRDAMLQVMDRIMSGQISEPELRDFLTTLARRGETAEEIAAAVEALRRYAVRLPLANPSNLCDTCGTGGDGQGTINVSTLAALVAAAGGVRIAKHGNRAASSRCGSADVLEALGLNLAATPAQVARCIDEVGFGFCFAPAFHPAMKVVAPVRRALGIRTLFNLVGPLANPAPLAYQLVGVSDSRLLAPMAEALQRLGLEHGLVVHGMDGLDEVTLTAQTEALEITPAAIRSLRLSPEALGLPCAAAQTLRGGDAAHNASRARAILGGEASAQRDLVAANAGCVLYVAGRAASPREGVAKAVALLDAGEGLTLLERVTQRMGADA